MTALQGKTFKYGMPIYGVEWPEGDVVYLCGGGGMGIKNRLAEICRQLRSSRVSHDPDISVVERMQAGVCGEQEGAADGPGCRVPLRRGLPHEVE